MTVNDYLAGRDAAWMGPVHELLGLRAAAITAASTTADRRAAYEADVLYGSLHELAFDVLRDRLARDPAELVARRPDAFVVDEADAVLVDEARVPLVLAGAATDADDPTVLAEVVRALVEHVGYTTYSDGRNVALTERGARQVEAALGGIDLFAVEHGHLLAATNVALHAEVLLQRDVDYVVAGGAVKIVNHSRGRVDPLQRWPDGLQAAVEAKEGLVASAPAEILDSSTVRAIIRRALLVGGMTATGMAVAERLVDLYGLEVARVPPRLPCIRVDGPDRLFRTAAERDAAVVAEVVAQHAVGRPVLVGTLDVAESERVAEALTAAGVPCRVLNARNDAEEADLVALAGTYGTVTVSTQMAGRGVDIRLGGPDEADHDRVAALGGLLVLATGHYPTSRLDDQLRGRSGRQGDPGASVVLASLEDQLVSRYAPHADLSSIGLDADDRGETRDPEAFAVVAHAQRVAEGVQIEVLRNTWLYERVAEKQRAIALARRDEVLHGSRAADHLVAAAPETWAHAEVLLGPDGAAVLARQVVLHELDRAWCDHLGRLAHLREGIHLRALGRLSPVDEYYREAIPAFHGQLHGAEEAAVPSFADALHAVEADGRPPADAAAAIVPRPTATWTYVVEENPFGTEFERALALVRGWASRRR